MARNEVEMTEEEHMLGKAIFGIIAMVLVGLFVAFTMLGEKEIPINYMDDITNLKTKDTA
jgi:preprotein translocase subunit SecY